jgi:Spy/CpxP family protein refolding chaperone
MKNRFIKSAGMFLLCLLFVSGVNAQRYRQGAGHDGPRAQRETLRNSAIERLALTEEQQKNIQTLRQEQFKTMKPLRSKMVELRAKERTLLSQEEIDQKAINKVIDEQTDLTNQMRKLQLDHKLAVRKVLTEEQIMKLEMQRERRKEFRSRGDDRWGPSRRGRPHHRIWG